jgi:hypothetical protein
MQGVVHHGKGDGGDENNLDQNGGQSQGEHDDSSINSDDDDDIGPPKGDAPVFEPAVVLPVAEVQPVAGEVAAIPMLVEGEAQQEILRQTALQSTSMGTTS